MTLDRESELALEADAPEVQRFVIDRGGQLHAPSPGGDAGVWWAQLHPAAHPDESYAIRIVWAVYPVAPPSVKFSLTVGGGVDDPTAWPVIPGYRAPSLDICMPFTAEGFSLHPDWANTTLAWKSVGNPFLGVVEQLQRDLNSPNYAGRFPG